MASSSSQPVAGTSNPKLAKAAAKSIKRSKHTSTLELVISKTRPKDLPPKPREEDLKHLKEFGEMMKDSKKAEQQRKEREEKHRHAKELAMAADLPIWEKDIVPNWKAVLDDEASVHFVLYQSDSHSVCARSGGRARCPHGIERTSGRPASAMVWRLARVRHVIFLRS